LPNEWETNFISARSPSHDSSSEIVSALSWGAVCDDFFPQLALSRDIGRQFSDIVSVLYGGKRIKNLSLNFLRGSANPHLLTASG
jgi:hypothetical protein